MEDNKSDIIMEKALDKDQKCSFVPSSKNRILQFYVFISSNLYRFSIFFSLEIKFIFTLLL